MTTACKYIFMFFAYSACGWFGESLYRTLGAYIKKGGEKRIINTGFLFGPICPIYGTGALFFTILLYNTGIYDPIFPGIFHVFLLGLFVADVVEYITSYLMEKLFNARWWDYSNNFLNLHGRICFKHSIYWGIASVLFIYVIHPMYLFVTGFLTDPVRNLATVLILLLFAFDLIMTVRATADIRKFTMKLRDFRDAVGVVTDVIKDSTESKAEEVLDAINARGAKFAKYTAELNEQFSELRESFSQLIAYKSPSRYPYKTRRLFTNGGNLSERSGKILDELENRLSEYGIWIQNDRNEPPEN